VRSAKTAHLVSLEKSWPSDKFSKVLQATSNSKYDGRHLNCNTGPVHSGIKLCGGARRRDYNGRDDKKIARSILKPIYQVYIDMHQCVVALRIRLFACTGDFAVQYPLCHCEDHHLYLTPYDHGGSTVITFARIAALVHPTSETSTPALALVTAVPGASPATTFTPDPGAAAEDDGKPWPGISQEMDVHEPPTVNRAYLANTLDPQSSSLPSITAKIILDGPRMAPD
jgi:hypothetical protein